jgi:drug/metabolite transporter (DMT)-like permease
VDDRSPGAAAGSSDRPLDAGAILIVVVLSLSWGFNQVAVKLALPDVPPLTQGVVRSIGAAILLVAWSRLRGVRLVDRDGTLLHGTIAGLLFGLEFILIYRGLLLTTASRAVLFLYCAPFIVALEARWFIPGERLTPLQWVGLALSFGGVAIALKAPRPAADASAIAGDLMMIAAAAAWATTTVVIKASVLVRAPFEKTLLYQLVVSAPLLALAAAAFGEQPTATPSAVSVAAVGYQTVWVVGVTFLAWFALLQRYSASRLTAFTFLTPLFGAAAGYVVLGEPLSPPFLAAVGAVAAGLVLVNRTS